MRLSQLIEKLEEEKEIEYIKGSKDIEVTEVVNDSRKVTKGSLFLCISGAVSDGHSYAKDVVSKGAKVLVVEKEVEEFEGVTIVKVKNSRYAMALIAAAYYNHPAEELKVIGITGTKGKTTTTYMVKSILENAGHKVGLIGTIEIIIGEEHIPAFSKMDFTI